MRSDTTRQVVTVLAYIVTLALNTAATTIPLGGQATNVISDSFHVYVIPAGYVFSIWGLIYTMLGVFTVWQALPRNRTDETARALGWLPALTGLLNSLWIVFWQYRVFLLAVPVIVALLVTLIAIHFRLWPRRGSLTDGRFWAVRAPWSVYLGWITVATIANIAQTLQWLGVDAGAAAPFIAALVLLTGVAIASRFVWQFGDAAYGWVIVWAYVGVAVKESSTPIVAGTALAGALIVATLVVAAMLGRRSTSRFGRAIAGA
ncbi:MAG: TspO/MBR family protein [Chloroflexota bacterium]